MGTTIEGRPCVGMMGTTTERKPWVGMMGTVMGGETYYYGYYSIFSLWTSIAAWFLSGHHPSFVGIIMYGSLHVSF